MPADGFPFAVRVGCDQNVRRRVLRLERAQFSDHILFVWVIDISRFKAVRHVHAQFFERQITEMPDGRNHFKIPPDQRADCFRLVGGFDDDDFTRHSGTSRTIVLHFQ